MSTETLIDCPVIEKISCSELNETLKNRNLVFTLCRNFLVIECKCTFDNTTLILLIGEHVDYIG